MSDSIRYLNLSPMIQKNKVYGPNDGLLIIQISLNVSIMISRICQDQDIENQKTKT